MVLCNHYYGHGQRVYVAIITGMTSGFLSSNMGMARGLSFVTIMGMARGVYKSTILATLRAIYTSVITGMTREFYYGHDNTHILVIIMGVNTGRCRQYYGHGQIVYRPSVMGM
jgi:hypothetical protein